MHPSAQAGKEKFWEEKLKVGDVSAQKHLNMAMSRRGCSRHGKNLEDRAAVPDLWTMNEAPLSM